MRQQRRTKQQWDSIFASQITSGLTASEYCAKHGIHHKTFSARKSDFNKRTSQSTSNKLVKVVTSKPKVVSSTSPFSVVYRDVILNVDQAVEARWLADVIKALAS
tara:strand:- start:566 stop:880 length:315 start_codon:yes stop_codon:yes gene_type:complete